MYSITRMNVHTYTEKPLPQPQRGCMCCQKIAVGYFLFCVFSVMFPTLTFGYVAPRYCTLHQLGVRSSFTLHPTAIRLHCNYRYCCYTTCYIFALCKLTTIFQTRYVQLLLLQATHIGKCRSQTMFSSDVKNQPHANLRQKIKFPFSPF